MLTVASSPYILLPIAIVCEVIATLLLNASQGWTQWRLGLFSISFYAIAGVLLSLVLERMSVGIAYAIWAGVGIALICLASALLWNQRMDWAALVGIGMILTGVCLITLKSGVVLH